MQTPELKQYLYSLVFLTDEVDDKGKPITRTAFAKDVYRGCSELRKLLLSVCEAGWMKKDADPKGLLLKDLEWKLVGENVEDSKIVAERFKDDELTFTTPMKDAVSFYFKATKEMPALPDETVKELETIFGLKI